MSSLERKLVLTGKQDLDLDLNMPKFNCFFPGDQINDEDHARALFQNALQANPQLAYLSGMDAGISIKFPPKNEVTPKLPSKVAQSL